MCPLATGAPKEPRLDRVKPGKNLLVADTLSLSVIEPQPDTSTERIRYRLQTGGCPVGGSDSIRSTTRNEGGQDSSGSDAVCCGGLA